MLIIAAGTTPAHKNSPKLTCQPLNFAVYAWFLFRNTQTGAAQCSSCTHAYGKPDEKHDKTTAAILRQKQNWLGMCGFASETLRLERHSAHHCSRHHAKELMKTAPIRHTNPTTLRQKQNWLAMRGFSSGTLRLERHSAHHVLMRMASPTKITTKQLPQSCVRSRTGWVCVVSLQKQHMKTAPNRLRAAQLCIRSRTGWLCVVSLQRHSDWSGTALIIAAVTTPRIT